MNVRKLTNEENAVILASIETCRDVFIKNPEKCGDEAKKCNQVIQTLENSILLVIEMTPEEKSEFKGNVHIERMGKFIGPLTNPNPGN